MSERQAIPVQPRALAKLGHVALTTTDLDMSLRFWRDTVGLEEVDRSGDSVYLRAWGDFEHHTLSLRAATEAAVDHIAWRTCRRVDVESYAEALEQAGIATSHVAAGTEPGLGAAIRFATPGGHCFELYYDSPSSLTSGERRSRLKTNASPAFSHGISPRRLDHVNLTTRDARAMCTWLASTFEFKMRELLELNDGSMGGGWMAVSALGHDIAVRPDRAGRSDGFHHVAFQLENWQDVMRGADILMERGFEIDAGPGKHGISQGVFLYARDPGSGHRVELFSGGYLVLEPEWEPIVWTEDELALALTWWGPRVDHSDAMGVTTGFSPQPIAVPNVPS